MKTLITIAIALWLSVVAITGTELYQAIDRELRTIATTLEEVAR